MLNEAGAFPPLLKIIPSKIGKISQNKVLLSVFSILFANIIGIYEHIAESL